MHVLLHAVLLELLQRVVLIGGTPRRLAVTA